MAVESKKIKRVLIANRGEIAVRIIRTLRNMGIESVTVYSDADAESSHRSMADYAVRLPGTLSSETYLKIESIIAAAKASKADAIHPGYGFLSENQNFAEQIIKAGLVFIGPNPTAIRSMGDKIEAKALMRKAGVPVTPGSQDACESVEDVKKVIAGIGLPVILKAAAGGGGRGMQVIRKESETPELFARCQREALAYFGNGSVFCEKYIEHPRHIEIQILCDQHGNGLQLFERDCTIQRRHQKLIEEAPSSYTSPELRAKLGQWALLAAKAVNYHGAGTVEFICASPTEAYFMEMNTRIQVEHPVTEMITGVDLIEEQVRVARGETLSVKQEQLHINGHAIEVRINAEDPFQGFQPTPGRIEKLHLPAGPFVRVDTHIYEGYEVPQHYDSMIAKLIAWGPNRNAAIQRVLTALSEFQCLGVQTTASFHERVLTHPRFLEGDFSTRFIEEEHEALLQDQEIPRDQEILMAAAALAIEDKLHRSGLTNVHQQSPWGQRALQEQQRDKL